MKTDSEKSGSLEKWEKSEKEKLGHSHVRLIEAVTNLRDLALTSVQSSVSARMVSIKTSKSSMQAAQNEKDTFRFLQMYSQVHEDVEKAKAVDLRNGLEPGSDRDTLVQEIRQNGKKMMEQVGHFWGSLLTLVDPENHQELVATSSDLIFDPKTLDPSMSLSKDKRKVFHNSRLGQCSATLLIHSSQSLPNFQRWMISLSQDCDWTIGLCDKQPAKNLRDGHVYGLCCKGNQLSSLTTEYDDCCDATIDPQRFGQQKSDTKKTERKRTVSSALIKHQGTSGDQAVPRPEMVEVFWNFPASSLSFYSRTGQYEREEVITIKMSLNNWDLVPFVQLVKENGQNMSQQDWTCSCGQKYNKYNNRYSKGGCEYSFQANCSCGALIGDVYTTEMVCELK